MNSFVKKKIIKINNFIGKLFEELCWENCPAIHVGGAHELFRRVTQQIHLGGLSNVFISKGCPQLKQIFLFGKRFSYMAQNMCEGVGEDSRHEIGHEDIRVGIMNSLECVCCVFFCHCMST